MKKFIVFLVMLLITTMIYAKQFCVRIDTYKVNSSLITYCDDIDITPIINEYLNKGYKLVSMVAINQKVGNSSKTKYVICVFDDGE